MTEASTKTPEEVAQPANVPVVEEPKKLDEWIAFLRDIVIILVLVVFIRTYVAAPFRIS